MSEIIESVLTNADYLILLLLRVGGLVVPSPIFGRVGIPNTTKIVFAVALTYFAFTVYPPVDVVEYTSLAGYLLVCASELLLGIALAFVTNLFFTLTFTAGHMIDMQIGFGIVNVYDIQNKTQVPMVGNIYNLILLIIFFGVDGHQQIIRIIYRTLEYIPVGQAVFSREIGLVAMEVFAKSVAMGAMIALPMVASGIIIEFGMGILIRTVPQLNMFVVGMPTKLMIGLVLLLSTFPVFVTFSNNIFSEMMVGVEKMFNTFLVAS